MKFFIHVICLLTSFSLFAQQGQWPGGGGKGGNWKDMAERMKVGHFYGKIVDSTNNKGVEFASVQLIGNVFDTTTKQMKKDVVIAGQLTESNGDFSLEKINVMGKFKLKISAMGYTQKEIPVSFDVDMDKIKSGGMSMLGAMDRDLGNIRIRSSVTQLKEVNIIAEAPAMELKLDKKVFNVEKNMVSTGGTAEDVLKQVPSVSVDMDGNVSLRNSSPQIFVDGKPTTLTIDQIPADAIQSIEVITNPSAKYDASGGGGGILNIVLKKDKRMGYNGNVRAGIDQRGKVNGGCDLNTRQGKINVFVSGNLNQRKSLMTGTTDRENLIGFPLTTISQDQNTTNTMSFAMGRAGFDWFKDNRNTFTFSGNFVQGMFKSDDNLTTKTDTLHPSYSDYTTYNRFSPTNRQFKNYGGSFQYKHIFPKEGEEWTADLNYNKASFVSGGNYFTNYYKSSGDAIGSQVVQNMDGNGYTEIFTGQTDFVIPLKEKTKIETGVRGSYRNFLSKTDNFLKNDSTGEFYLIKNQSTNYKFNDQVYAGYVTYSRQINKFSYQAGLRGESSFYTGQIIDSNQTFKNTFPVSLFPSAFTSYELNPKNTFQLSYSRRINRPTFFQLIPFTDYSDSMNLKRGNPKLKPEFTHSIELSYLNTFNQANNILITGYFKATTGLISNFQEREYDSTLHKFAIINTYQNANASYVYGGEFTSKNAIKKWLDVTMNVNVYYSIIDANNLQASLINKQFSWFVKGTATLKLPKNFSIQLSPEYRSKASVPVSSGGGGRYGGGMGGGGPMGGGNLATPQGYIQAKFDMDAAIKFEFLKQRAASITVSMRDIFSSDISETITNSYLFNQTTTRIRDPHFVRVNFSYRFGKFDTSLFKRKNNKVNTEGMDMGM